jgi:hypothetical protein
VTRRCWSGWLVVSALTRWCWCWLVITALARWCWPGWLVVTALTRLAR